MSVALVNLEATPGNIALIVFHMCLATCCTLSNLLLLMALLGSAALLRRNNHLYTLSITISELMVGAGWFYIALYDENDTFGPLYSPRNVHTTVHGISLITVLASMIDRYLCVKYPFKYSQKMTRIKAVAIIAITWLGPIATVVLKIIFPNKKEKTFQGYITILFSVVMLGVMVILNVRLYLICRLQQNRQQQDNNTSQKQSAQLIVFASMIFITLWTPGIVYVCICYGFGICSSFLEGSTNAVVVIRMFNAITTPLIFLFGSPMTRASLMNVFTFLKIRR
ncbi:unnamed protein product [Lampetra planeri]